MQRKHGFFHAPVAGALLGMMILAGSAAAGDSTRYVSGLAPVIGHSKVLGAVRVRGLSPARAAIVEKEVGVPAALQLPADIAPAQQKLADLFQANGEIPSKVDVSAEFDGRFNTIVQKAQGQ